MSDIEIAYLKEEVARQNKILAILIEQNKALKNEIAAAKINDTSADDGSAFDKFNNGTTDVSGALSHFIEVSPHNISSLGSVLKASGFNKVRKTGIRNAAMVLLHFYNKGGGSHAELRKLTGLSRFGMAKFTRSLKKRGLIHRDGWQKFKLSTQAMSLIRQAMLKN